MALRPALAPAASAVGVAPRGQQSYRTHGQQLAGNVPLPPTLRRALSGVSEELHQPTQQGLGTQYRRPLLGVGAALLVVWWLLPHGDGALLRSVRAVAMIVLFAVVALYKSELQTAWQGCVTAFLFTRDTIRTLPQIWTTVKHSMAAALPTLWLIVYNAEAGTWLHRYSRLLAYCVTALLLVINFAQFKQLALQIRAHVHSGFTIDQWYQQLRQSLRQYIPAAQATGALLAFTWLSWYTSFRSALVVSALISTLFWKRWLLMAKEQLRQLRSRFSCWLTAHQYPSGWRKHGGNLHLETLAPTSEEYLAAAEIFHRSLPNATILSITRIQNWRLWQRFRSEQQLIEQSLGSDANVQYLFHGTSGTNPKLIYDSDEGFDFRVSSAGYYGRGVYFAERATYSDAYSHRLSDGTRCMFLAQVLCGAVKAYGTTRASGLTRPPEMPDEPNRRYHSISGGPWEEGSPTASTMFVIYNLAQAYPQFLITYKP